MSDIGATWRKFTDFADAVEIVAKYLFEETEAGESYPTWESLLADHRQKPCAAAWRSKAKGIVEAIITDRSSNHDEVQRAVAEE
jgi:hypothetical protein